MGVGVGVVVVTGAVVEVLDKSWVMVGQNDLCLAAHKETESLHDRYMDLNYESLVEE